MALTEREKKLVLFALKVGFEVGISPKEESAESDVDDLFVEQEMARLADWQVKNVNAFYDAAEVSLNGEASNGTVVTEG